ncbi:uncharacterized protein LOC131298632 [Rhododendron vialii]|uniref:uncharacterized protein LOC131298632 n=1 Tax=Rhododendron vialii TaxID=182163 RepID=UPI00265F48D3|nr:uncharacterized protein LOC131298632 [Rhododendron vialii]
MAWLCKLLRGGVVHQAVFYCQMPVFFLVKERATNNKQDEKAKVAVVQQRGRFKVTSKNVELDKVALSPLLQKSRSMQVIAHHPSFPLPPSSPSDPTLPKLVGHSLFLMVQSVLHTNTHQREIILSLMKRVSVGDFTVDRGGLPMNTSVAEKSLVHNNALFLGLLELHFEEHDGPSLNDQTRTISGSLVNAMVEA